MNFFWKLWILSLPLPNCYWIFLFWLTGPFLILTLSVSSGVILDSWMLMFGCGLLDLDLDLDLLDLDWLDFGHPVWPGQVLPGWTGPPLYFPWSVNYTDCDYLSWRQSYKKEFCGSPCNIITLHHSPVITVFVLVQQSDLSLLQSLIVLSKTQRMPTLGTAILLPHNHLGEAYPSSLHYAVLKTPPLTPPCLHS